MAQQGGQALPEVKRSTEIQGATSIPNFGDEYRNAAAATNSLSQIGATVAQTASTAIAKQRGYEMGQNPSGSLLPPITSFDKTLADSYNKQAQSTLTLQGNQLMMDADLEMSKATRLTPDMIARNTQEVAKGLQRIAANAPNDIQGSLNETFASQLQRTRYQYQNKMIGQQKDEQKNTALASLTQNAQTAFELAASGDYKGAQRLAAESKGIADNAHANMYITPAQAKVAHDTVVQAGLNGKYINIMLNAKANGTLAQAEADFQKTKPKGMTFEQWQTTGSAVSSYMGTLQSLKNQDDQIRATQFQLAYTKDVTGITGQMVQDLKDNVSPQVFEEANLGYIRALKANEKATKNVENLIAGFGDPNVFARGTADEKNLAFDTMVQRHMQNMQNQGISVSKDEAEAQIATSAAGSIPGYVSVLKSKLASTDPTQIESAGVAIEHMMQAGKGQNLGADLGTDALGMYKMYSSLRSSYADPKEAAQAAHEVIYGKDPETLEANNKKFTNFIQQKVTSQGKTTAAFALEKAHIKPENMPNAQLYGTSLMTAYEGFYKLTNGDEATADSMYKDYVKQMYGETNINGQTQTTYMPLEKVLNLPHDATGVIQADVVKQVTTQFESTKKMYDEGKVNWYWEVLPRTSAESIIKHREKVKQSFQSTGFGDKSLAVVSAVSEQISKFHQGEPIKVVKHYRARPSENFELVLNADPWLAMTGNPDNPIAGGWDIGLKTPNGVRSIYRDDPASGIISYVPDAKAIKANYMAVNHINLG